MLTATGSEFWLALSKTQPPLIDLTMVEIYCCPFSRKKEGCTYAGPAQDVNELADGDPVGLCDDPGHGETVVILYKSADVRIVPRNGEEHRKALEKTKK